MRLLRVLGLGLVLARGGGHVAIAVALRHQLADRRDRLGHDLHAVGPHIGDEAFGFAAEIDAFVEPLRELHGMAGRVAELARCLLLQGRGGEGRGRIAALRLAFDTGNEITPAFERGLQAKRGGLIGDIELLKLLAADGKKPRLKRLVLCRGKLGQDRPIFLRPELLDLELAIADEPERHRLHAAGGAGARQFPPQDRGEREAHEIVERAAGEIGIDEGPVDRARIAHGVEHGLLGHGIEDDALDRHAGQSLLAVEHLQHVPGDGFALAIGVGCEDQLLRPLHGLGDFVEPFGGLGLDVPMHLEILVGKDRAVFRRQIAHMAVGGEHAVAGPEILVDRLCLGWRFYDDDVH